MLDLALVVLAFVLLAGAVVGSVVPSIPGAALSLAGVLLYWWVTGEPGTLLLAVLVVVALLTWAVDLFAGAIAARVGGASTSTAAIAGLVGLVLFFVAGPLGIILGVAGTVFLIELVRQDARHGAKAALVTTAGMLASAVAQVILTASILLTMIVVALF